MTFPTYLKALGYNPQPYAYRGETCWSVSAHGLSVAILAGAVVQYEGDERLEPDDRAMVVRALRGARVDSLGLDVVVYFPSELVKW